MPNETVTRPTPKQPIGVGSGGCGLLFGLGWTGFSLLFVIIPIGILVTEWQTFRLLQNTGTITEAVVIGRRIHEDSESDTYYVTYQYRVWLPTGDPTQLTHEESVTYDTYQALPPESRVFIRYSTTNPEVVRLEGQSKIFEAIMLTCFALFGGLFVLVGIWLIRSGWQEIGQTCLLVRQGVMTTGHLTDRWIETDSDGDKQYCVAFQFVVPGEPEVTAAEYNRKAYNSLQVGDSAQVRYVPGKTEICRLEL